MSDNIFNSSSLSAKIIELRAKGSDIKEICLQLSLAEEDVNNVLSKLQQIMPLAVRKKVHQLTDEERCKGGKASQIVRQEQRKEAYQRVKDLLDTDDVSHVELAIIQYLLCGGSNKGFSILIKDEVSGLVFLRALRHIGVPEDSIRFTWGRLCKNGFEIPAMRKRWGKLGSHICFQENKDQEKLRLTIKPFDIEDESNPKAIKFKVSSRALAMAFLEKGKEVFENAAKE